MVRTAHHHAKLEFSQWSTSALLSVVLTPVRRTYLFILPIVIYEGPSTQQESRVNGPRQLIRARLHAGMRVGQSFVICVRIVHEEYRAEPWCAAAMQRQQGGEGEASQDLPRLQGQEGNGRAQSRRCGRGEASPGADVAGMISDPVQMCSEASETSETSDCSSLQVTIDELHMFLQQQYDKHPDPAVMPAPAPQAVHEPCAPACLASTRFRWLHPSSAALAG